MKAKQKLVDAAYHLRSVEEKLRQGVSCDPIVQVTDELLHKAIITGASDIHIQPGEQVIRVRYRIDGILYDQETMVVEHYLPVISRLKLLANLDIAQSRMPQDGKIRVSVNKKSKADKTIKECLIDLRISTFPSLYGEKMVVRILDRSENIFDLTVLGFSEKMVQQVSHLIADPHGFFLVTGPTGSGKSTTLYSLLSKINKPECNIVTMEDPIEYDLAGITQSQVNERAGFTFEAGLRCLLRQDPDVIMLGEIRDVATVQIAIEAALTGHLVFSTLHTNDAPGVVTRLLDMGVEPFLINATLTAVLAQQLVRILCDHCKKEVNPNAHLLALAKKNNITLMHAYQAQGCVHCFNTGYKGRIGLFELLVVDDKLRELIIQKTSGENIRKQALVSGMISMVQDGLTKMNQGIVSIEDFLCTVKE